MQRTIFKLATLPALLLSSLSVYAATPVNLAQQSISTIINPASFSSMGITTEETKRATDFNQTLHVRIKQTYQGHAVWGGEGVVHIPNAGHTKKALANTVNVATTMNGNVFKALDQDLAGTPATVLTADQAEKALQTAIDTYQHKVGGKADISKQKTELMVYVDESNKAHWAYRVSFKAAPLKSGALPEMPVSIMDAQSFNVYLQWNDVKTIEDSTAGGFGGNEKMGKLTYDGLTGDLPSLKVHRDASTSLCYLQNDDVTVKDKSHSNKVMQFSCKSTDSTHNGVYWNANHDAVNGAFSPSNDALYAGAVIKDMYQKWYNVPVLTESDGTPMMLNMVVHERDLENAYWDGEQMTFGDGGSTLYPLTSLGVAAHEVSHGFTEQHSNLTYTGQSGGMNESFSDMAAAAAEFYSYGKNVWTVGAEIFKGEGEALRYMDQPSKDCHGGWAGWGCSIDSADQYGWGWIDVHHSSGVYNHFFYYLATSKGWDTKKAFDVMVQANANYWTSSSTFASAACGVLQATKDHKYDVKAVKAAFSKVAIDTSGC